MAGRRIPTNLRVLLAGAFVADVGAGLTIPFLLIYLHQVRGISLGTAGLLIGGVALVALPVAPATGTLVDRLGPRFVAIAALGTQALGTASLVFVHGPVSAVVPMLLFGLGQGARWPAWNALIAVLIPEDEMRPKVFALNFQLLNLGLGVGSLIGGLVVRVSDVRSFIAVYLGDAGSTILMTGVLALLPVAAYATTRATPGTGPGQEVAIGAEPDPAVSALVTARRPGYRLVMSDRRLVRYLFASTLLAIAGYGALSAGFVGFATAVVHATPRTIAWAFAANTGFIVAAQPLGLFLARRMRRTTALSVVAGFFAASWIVLLVAGAFPRSAAGDGLTIAMFVVFAIGETLLSPVWVPLVNDLAPPELRGRYNAAAAGVYSVAAVISPAIAGVMLGASLGPEYLALLVACCAGAVLGFKYLRGALWVIYVTRPAEVQNLWKTGPQRPGRVALAFIGPAVTAHSSARGAEGVRAGEFVPEMPKRAREGARQIKLGVLRSDVRSCRRG